MRSKTVLGVAGCAVAMVFGDRASAGPDWADPTIYGTPVNLGAPVNSAGAESQLTLSGDELTLIFVAGWTLWGPPRPGSGNTMDLWLTTRSSRSEAWAEPVPMGAAINTESMQETAPSLSADGMELYFTRLEGLSTSAVHSIWVTTRASLDDAWAPAQKLPPWINAAHITFCPNLSPDGLTLYYASTAEGTGVFASTRASRSAPWGIPVKIGPYPAVGGWWPCISADGLSLLATRMQQTFVQFDIQASTRNTPGGSWGERFALPPPVNVPGTANGATWLSLDGTSLYFISSRPGGWGSLDLWQVPILTPADFDRDRDVDGDDVTIFVACVTGPEIPYDLTHLPAGCTVTIAAGIIPPDFDADADVDQVDFGVFQRCFSGADKLPDPQCAN